MLMINTRICKQFTTNSEHETLLSSIKTCKNEKLLLSIKDDLLKTQCDLKQNQDELLKIQDNLLKIQNNLKYINTSVNIKISVTTVLVISCGIYVFVP